MSDVSKLIKRANRLLAALSRGEHLSGLSGPERQEFRDQYWLLRSIIYSNTYDLNKLEWVTARAEIMCENYGIDV